MEHIPVRFDAILEAAQKLPDHLKQQLVEILQRSVPPDTVQESVWTDAEIEELMTIEPLSPKEIVEEGLLGGLKHRHDMADSAGWVREQRNKARP